MNKPPNYGTLSLKRRPDATTPRPDERPPKPEAPVESEAEAARREERAKWLREVMEACDD